LYLWFVEELQGSLVPFQQICLGLVQASTVATAPYKKANHCECMFVMKNILNTQMQYSCSSALQPRSNLVNSLMVQIWSGQAAAATLKTESTHIAV